MNRLELRMVDKLRELKEKHAAVGVRAEFEAEGMRIEELLRLKEICMTADVSLTLKIGGCESIRDMLEARVVGVNTLVAPIVESAYALQKYLQAVAKVFPAKEREGVEVLCNIETATACANIGAMLGIPEIKMLKGIVIERVDLCFSKGLGEDQINAEEINEIVVETAKKAKETGLLCVLSGGMSAQTLPFISQYAHKYVDRYETRKITFDASKAGEHAADKGIMKALAFELLWLKNKLGYFNTVTRKDRERMEMIEQRYWKEVDELI